MLMIISQKDILGFNQQIHHRGTGNCILILFIFVYRNNETCFRFFFFFVKDFYRNVINLNME